MWQGDWSTLEIQQRLREVLERISEIAESNTRQLIIAAAAARSAGLPELESRLLSRLISTMGPADNNAAPVQMIDQSAIPDSLRTSTDVPAILLARRIAVEGDRRIAEQLLAKAITNTNSRLHSFVQLAVLNDGLLLAEQLALPRMAAEITNRRNQIAARHLTTAAPQSGTDIQAAVNRLLQAQPPQP